MAVYPITCGSCGRGVSANVLTGDPGKSNVVLWLQCPNCGEGSVRLTTGAVYPTAPAGGAVASLPADVEQAWREVRTSHAVAAYTAAEMMCRKILMHIAVDQAKAKQGDAFAAYVEALDKAGFIAPGLRPVVTLVKDRGNAANHDLPASTEGESLQTMSITEHLLRTIYELPGLAPSAP